MGNLSQELSNEYLKKAIEAYESNNIETAYSYFIKAARTYPNSRAEHYLFTCLFDGIGTSTNKQLALMHLAKSISLGNKDALIDLEALMTEED